ncbi:thiamine-phosphate kinase [Synechococcus sp. UW140]|uniref:thiamine-phosphate kinase n=1 Tax=Synechococcus sp. UW140 TaxID=368503 RepID=UPI00313796E3
MAELAELGEAELIAKLSCFAAAGQFDDDAALLAPDQELQRVVSTDAMVEGVHFSANTTPAFSVGWRAAAANLSDLAAMGCLEAEGITVALAAPGHTPLAWVEAVYGGLSALLKRHNCQLLGGDCSSAPVVMLAITAIGKVAADRLIRRGAGRAGDRLVVSGPHGLSGLGLQLLQNPNDPATSHLSESLKQAAIKAHQQPIPRFDAVAALHQSQPAACPWRVAGTDSSDGLRRSLELLGNACGHQPMLDLNMGPLEPWCLDGGEDFELVLALDPLWADNFVAQLPGAQCIGWLGDKPGPPCWLSNKKPLPVGRGYEHFKGN